MSLSKHFIALIDRVRDVISSGCGKDSSYLKGRKKHQKFPTESIVKKQILGFPNSFFLRGYHLLSKDLEKYVIRNQTKLVFCLCRRWTYLLCGYKLNIIFWTYKLAVPMIYDMTLCLNVLNLVWDYVIGVKKYVVVSLRREYVSVVNEKYVMDQWKASSHGCMVVISCSSQPKMSE